MWWLLCALYVYFYKVIWKLLVAHYYLHALMSMNTGAQNEILYERYKCESWKNKSDTSWFWLSLARLSVSLFISFATPLPDISSGFSVTSTLQLRQRGSSFAVVPTSPIGMQTMQDLVSGTFPRCSSGNPKDQTSEKHQEDSQYVHENCLWGRVLVRWVFPLVM